MAITTDELKLRVTHKHDTEENWLKATNFTPKQAEIIVYDIDGNYNYERFKIGDGITNVNDLPFANLNLIAKEKEAKNYLSISDVSLFSPFVKLKIKADNEIQSLGQLSSGYYNHNGVDFILNDDGTIVVNGYPESLATCYFYPSSSKLSLSAGQYKIKGSGTNAQLAVADANWKLLATSNNGEEKTFTISSTTDVIVYIYVNANSNADNVIVKPEIICLDTKNVVVNIQEGKDGQLTSITIPTGISTRVSAFVPETIFSIEGNYIINVTYFTDIQDYVRYSKQSLTEQQKKQARDNIGAITIEDISSASASKEFYGPAPVLPLLPGWFEEEFRIPIKIRIQDNEMNASGTGNVPYYRYIDRELVFEAWSNPTDFVYTETFTIYDYPGGMEQTLDYSITISYSWDGWVITNDTDGVVTFLIEGDITLAGSGKVLTETSKNFSIVNDWSTNNEPAIKIGNTILTETKLNKIIAFIDSIAD